MYIHIHASLIYTASLGTHLMIVMQKHNDKLSIMIASTASWTAISGPHHLALSLPAWQTAMTICLQLLSVISNAPLIHIRHDLHLSRNRQPEAAHNWTL